MHLGVILTEMYIEIYIFGFLVGFYFRDFDVSCNLSTDLYLRVLVVQIGV